MKVTIERRALETLLYAVLSCKCPVTEKTEKMLFLKFNTLSASELLDLKPFIDIADTNPDKTPLHLLLEFCSFYQSDPKDFSITHNDVLRYLCCRYHFDRMKGPASLIVTIDQAVRMVSHMLLPVSVKQQGDKTSAKFQFRNKSIIFNSVFMPDSITLSSGSCYGFHLGMIVSNLTQEQGVMIKKHLAVIPEFCSLCKQIELVDFKNFLGQDHHEEIVIRYCRSSMKTSVKP